MSGWMDHEEVVAALEAQVQQLRAENAALKSERDDWLQVAEVRADAYDKLSDEFDALQAENAALRQALSNIWRIAHNRKGQANEYVTGICEAAALKAASPGESTSAEGSS